jgi:hypothetical protein
MKCTMVHLPNVLPCQVVKVEQGGPWALTPADALQLMFIDVERKVSFMARNEERNLLSDLDQNNKSLFNQFQL